ncbi:hypothetical protein [Halobacteriovorax sp. CON-3]|uniref:hypothetical protein n=1 Tax=Halobacteriovorax sp. CON-3 TaxID=3157710 RepID=UPI00371BDFA1
MINFKMTKQEKVQLLGNLYEQEIKGSNSDLLLSGRGRDIFAKIDTLLSGSFSDEFLNSELDYYNPFS